MTCGKGQNAPLQVGRPTQMFISHLSLQITNFQGRGLSILLIERLIGVNSYLFQMPDTENGWREIAREFDVAWNFHHCVGCIDGKQNPGTHFC
jgi:hypothetical protein